MERKMVTPIEGEGLRGDGTPKWYVIHTYSGHENKVRKSIEKLVRNREMEDLIQSVVIPVEYSIEMKPKEKRIVARKLFPGYVIVKMIITNESWYLIRNTQGVTGFVGNASDPIPLSAEEVDRMGVEDISLKVGDTVKIVDGDFKGFDAKIDDIVEVAKEGEDEDKVEKIIKAKIFMLGREVSMDLKFVENYGE